jgi:hypothetical protein
MAYSINDIYNFMVYIVRKERGVFVTITEFENTLDNAQIEAVEGWFSLYGQNQRIHDALRKVRVQKDFTTSNGSITFESDYLHQLGGVYTISGSSLNVVNFVNEQEFALAAKSQLRPVTVNSPIAKDITNGFQIYPSSSYVGVYNYLRRPLKPVYGYTQATGSRTIVWNQYTSTNLEFSDVYVNNIISRALKFWGINMAEQDIEQFSQLQTQETK